MSLFDEVNTKLNALVDKLLPVLPKNWSSLARSGFYAEQYAQSRDDFRHGEGALQSVDLLDVLKKCRSAMPDFPAEAEFKALVQAMDRFVIASANSQRRSMSNGLAIYFPVIKEAYNPKYEKLDFVKISHWPRLFQALYVEEAKHNERPKFGKIELLDSAGKPTTSLTPLHGFTTSIEVDGTNMVWVTHMPGIRDAELGGVRVLVIDYVVDEHYLEKLVKGRQHFSQDVDLIMPQLADGKNKLVQHQFGLDYRMSNGEKTVQVMIDNSDLGHPTHFSVPVLIEDPSLGDKPVVADLYADAVDLSVTSCSLHGVARAGFEMTANTKITPLFWLYKDDGTRVPCTKDSLTWKEGLTFTMDLREPGDYEEILVAETMTGASTTARFGFKVAIDENLTKAKQSWHGVTSEVMLGEWEWILPTDPPRDMNTSMTLEPNTTIQPGKDEFIYNLTFRTKNEDGTPKRAEGSPVPRNPRPAVFSPHPASREP